MTAGRWQKFIVIFMRVVDGIKKIFNIVELKFECAIVLRNSNNRKYQIEEKQRIPVLKH